MISFLTPLYALEHPAWFKDSFLEMPEEVSEAKAENKRVLLYFHQAGCPYCAKLIKESFLDPEISHQIQKYFNLIELNIWGDREVIDFSGQETTEKDFTKALNIQHTPTLLFIDEQGKIIKQLNGYYQPHQVLAVINYIGQHLEKKQSFRDFYQATQQVKTKPQIYQDPSYLQAPYNLSKTTPKKPLLVLFEQSKCASCDELHQNINKESQLKKEFEKFQIVLLDRFSNQTITTPKGLKISMQQWAEQLNIQYAPSLLFFSEGQEVFRIEGWLKPFHFISSLEYISQNIYKKQPEFQRYLRDKINKLNAEGIHIDL